MSSVKVDGTRWRGFTAEIAWQGDFEILGAFRTRKHAWVAATDWLLARRFSSLPTPIGRR